MFRCGREGRGQIAQRSNRDVGIPRRDMFALAAAENGKQVLETPQSTLY